MHGNRGSRSQGSMDEKEMEDSGSSEKASLPRQGQRETYRSGCMVCGADLVYSGTDRDETCHYCGRVISTSTRCVNGHFVCNFCHSADALEIIKTVCLHSGETIPWSLWDHPFPQALPAPRAGASLPRPCRDPQRAEEQWLPRDRQPDSHGRQTGADSDRRLLRVPWRLRCRHRCGDSGFGPYGGNPLRRRQEQVAQRRNTGRPWRDRLLQRAPVLSEGLLACPQRGCRTGTGTNGDIVDGEPLRLRTV